MSSAGWYPDPAGRPHTYRYWDGTSWSAATTTDPTVPPPGAAPPPPPAAPSGHQQPYPQRPAPYQQPYQQQYGGFAPAPPPDRPGAGRTVGLVVLAVLVIIGLGIGGYFAVSALVGDDDAGGGNDAGGDRSSQTTDAPTDDETAGTDPTDDTTEPTGPTGEQCTGGSPTPSVTPPTGARDVSGGGLTIPVPRGYEPNVDYARPFTWADDFTPVQKVIELGEEQYGWVSIYGVGGLDRANGFDDPAQAAEAVMQCMAASPDLYSSFTGRVDVSSDAVTVDGHDAHQLTAELRVDDPNLDATGDLAQVVVVDTGDPETLGLYITVVPLGDDALAREQARMVDRIRVG